MLIPISFIIISKQRRPHAAHQPPLSCRNANNQGCKVTAAQHTYNYTCIAQFRFWLFLRRPLARNSLFHLLLLLSRLNGDPTSEETYRIL
jgi:hypothetical protein